MIVRFKLTMKDLVVSGKKIDQVTISWEEEINSLARLVDLSNKWIKTKNFLTARMPSLERVGESQLEVEQTE